MITLRKTIIVLLGLTILLNIISVGFIVVAGQPPSLMTPLTTLVTFSFAVLHAGGSFGWRGGVGNAGNCHRHWSGL